MKEAIEEFKNYTANYLEYGEKIRLKINHTLRVVDYCEKIAKSLNLNEEEIEIAKIIGLLHDIGRFEQWKVYNTFRDRDSIDHADLGVEILEKDNYLRKYIEDDKYDEIILNSIKYHNKYEISKDLDEKNKLFAKLIRDADKIDILYLRVIGKLEIELDNNPLNDSIYDSLINKKSINRKDLKTKTDRLGVSLGFIFDINYKESFKILREVKYFDKLIDLFKEKTNNNKLKEQLEEIRKVINNYIEVNLC